MRLLPLLTACLLSACTHQGEDAGSQVAARAQIADRAGTIVAVASARDLAGVTARIDVHSMPAGTYAVHIHSVGRCDPPSFESAGPHWNPTSRQHGRLNPQGRHFGDLPNIMVDAGRSGSVEFAIPGAILRGPANALLDGDGASVVIHANADDERTDPSGNSGARIACGVLG